MNHSGRTSSDCRDWDRAGTDGQSAMPGEEDRRTPSFSTKSNRGSPGRSLHRPGREWRTIRTQRRSKPDPRQWTDCRRGQVRRCSARRDLQVAGRLLGTTDRAGPGQPEDNVPITARSAAQAEEVTLSAAATERPQRLPGPAFLRFPGGHSPSTSPVSCPLFTAPS